MLEAGVRQREVAARLGVWPSSVSKLLARIVSGPPVVDESRLIDANFIEPHKPRVVRQVFDRKAVRAFIAAGGGEEARMKMLRKLGIGVAA